MISQSSQDQVKKKKKEWVRFIGDKMFQIGGMPEYYLKITMKLYLCHKLKFISMIGTQMHTFNIKNYFWSLFLAHVV